MRFYSMTFENVRNLPIYTFWELAKNIQRINAENDLRMLVMLQNVVGGNPREFFETLKKEQGKVLEFAQEAEVLDKSEFQALKRLMG